MFTKEELLIMWVPLMIVGGICFAVLTVNGLLSLGAAIMLEVLLGIALKAIARLINPSAPSKPEAESDEVQL